MKMLKEIVKYPLSIQGLPESSYEYVEVRSPYSGEVVAAIGQADEKAIDMALELEPDLITLDNILPDMLVTPEIVFTPVRATVPAKLTF